MLSSGGYGTARRIACGICKGLSGRRVEGKRDRIY